MKKAWDLNLWLADRPEHSFHLKAVNQLADDIQNGRLQPGEALPSTRILAAQLGVNRKTIQLVYEELEAQGWVVSKPRRGTFVAEWLPMIALEESDRLQLGGRMDSKQAITLAQRSQQDDAFDSATYTQINDGVPDERLLPYERLAKAYRSAIMQSVAEPVCSGTTTLAT